MLTVESVCSPVKSPSFRRCGVFTRPLTAAALGAPRILYLCTSESIPHSHSLSLHGAMLMMAVVRVFYVLSPPGDGRKVTI